MNHGRAAPTRDAGPPARRLLAADGTTKHAGGGANFDNDVKSPFHGVLYVLAEGGAERRVFAAFSEMSFARTGPKAPSEDYGTIEVHAVRGNKWSRRLRVSVTVPLFSDNA